MKNGQYSTPTNQTLVGFDFILFFFISFQNSCPIVIVKLFIVRRRFCCCCCRCCCCCNFHQSWTIKQILFTFFSIFNFFLLRQIIKFIFYTIFEKSIDRTIEQIFFFILCLFCESKKSDVSTCIRKNVPFMFQFHSH